MSKQLSEVNARYELGELLDEDLDFLIDQAKRLGIIATRWVEIETNGTSEEADDFYTFVQDTLSASPY